MLLTAMEESVSIGQKELEKRTGLDRRLIQYYSDMRILIPEVEEGGKGIGSPRRYGARNIEEAKLLRALKVYGVGLQAVREIMSAWREKREGLAAKQKKAKHLFIVVGKPEGERVKLRLATEHDCIVSPDHLTEVESAIVVKVF